MSVKAIVYTSETGFTAEYASILSKKTGIDVFSLEDAPKKLKQGTSVLYMGWLMAGSVKGLKKALKMFSVRAVVAVGLLETGTLCDNVREQNKIPESVKVFTVQGGYAPEKLRGMNKKMMKIVAKSLVKKIDKLPAKSEADYRMRKTLTVGGSFVDEANLKEVIAALQKLA